MPKTKTELFLELAQPDEEGRSRWVNVSEFIEKYKELKLGNGGSWCRKESTLAKNTYWNLINLKLQEIPLMLLEL